MMGNGLRFEAFFASKSAAIALIKVFDSDAVQCRSPMLPALRLRFMPDLCRRYVQAQSPWAQEGAGRVAGLA